MALSPTTLGRRLWQVTAAALVLAIALAAAIAARAFYYAALDMGGRGPASPLLDHPDRTRISGLVNVSFAAHGTLIAGWYVPSRNRAAVIVTTGTSSNRTSMLPEVRILASAGFGVLAFDWPGTGRSAGRIDWGDPALATLESAIDWLSPCHPTLIPPALARWASRRAAW